MESLKSSAIAMLAGVFVYAVVQIFIPPPSPSKTEGTFAISTTPTETSIPKRASNTPLTNANIGALLLSPSPSAKPSVAISEKQENKPTPIIYTPPVTPRPIIIASVSPTPTILPTQTPNIVPRVSESPTLTATPIISTPPTPTATATLPQTPAKIVINEIAWAGTAAPSPVGPSDEWIELYNAGEEYVALDGWSIYEGDSTKIISLSGNIYPNGYYLIERINLKEQTDDAVSDITADVFGSFGGSGLKNTGEDIRLKNSAGEIVDRVNCGAGWFAGEAKTYTTMERINPLVDGSVGSNWGSNNGALTTGIDAKGWPIHGTPRFKNSISP